MSVEIKSVTCIYPTKPNHVCHTICELDEDDGKGGAGLTVMEGGDR